MRIGRRPNGVVLCATAGALVALVFLAPAGARVAIRSIERAAGHGISGSVTYEERNPGKDQSGATVGVVGRGTFSGKARGPAAVVARSFLEVVKGVPVGALLRGGTYVTRYDIDAAGTYHGIVVGTFSSPGMGSLCISYVTSHGRFKAGQSFIPARVSFTTVGGTGEGARVRASGSVTQTDVTGSDIERLFGSGLVSSLSEGPAKPPSAACKSVAKLRR